MDSIRGSGVTYRYIFKGWRFAFFLLKQIDGSYVTIDVSTSGATYVVNTVDLKTKEVGEASDILHSTLQPAVVASSNRLIVCGGLSQQKIVNYCQVYSTQTNEWAFVLILWQAVAVITS